MLVDARLARRRRTGVATYVHELRAAMEALDAPDLRVEWLAGPPGLPRRNLVTKLGNLLLDLAWVHVWVPLTAWRRRAALIHAPFNWAPAVASCPRVVTVHDLSFEHVPKEYAPDFLRFARVFTRRSAGAARVVVSVSESTARDLEERYGVERARIRVVHHGVHVDRRPAGEPREPFVLHVGEFEPRKRVLDLIAGHRRYVAAAPPVPQPCRLVLAGAGGAQEAAVRAAAGPECDALGFVADEVLTELYRHATALVLVSRHEGFGMPIAEAMAHGCPVIVADTSSLPEVAGPEGLVLESADPEGIAAGLVEALADREGLAARGLRAQDDAERRFSWPRAAEQTLGAYREALG